MGRAMGLVAALLALLVAGGAAEALVLEHKLLLITSSPYRRWATGFIEKVMLGARSGGRAAGWWRGGTPGGTARRARDLWQFPFLDVDALGQPNIRYARTCHWQHGDWPTCPPPEPAPSLQR